MFRLVLDIGGKLTWIIDSNYGLKKHMSMIAGSIHMVMNDLIMKYSSLVPKLLRCNDCDAIIDRTRTQAHCDCHSEVSQGIKFYMCKVYRPRVN